MYRSLKRFLLGTLTGLLFLYLAFNAAINAVGLTERLEQRVSQKLRKPVEFGFVYFDWAARPRLSHYLMWGDSSNTNRTPLVRISDILIFPDWGRILNARVDLDQFAFVRRVRFGYLDINLGDVPDSEKLFRNLPPIPATAPRWSVEYRNDTRSVFRVSGRRMRYVRNDRPVKLTIEQLNREPLLASATMRFLPDLRWRFDVEKGSLPRSLWPMEENQWSGMIRFQSNDSRGRLTVDLQGIPGSVRQVTLPRARLSAKADLGRDTSFIESVRLSSEYMNFDWGGTVTRTDTGRRVSAHGDLFVNAKKLGNYFLRQGGANRFQITQAYPLNGQFTLRGPLHDPALSGRVDARKIAMRINRPDTNSKVTFQNWQGETRSGTFVLTKGRIREDDNRFRLESGYVNVENDRFMTSLTGKLRGRSPPGRFINRFEESLLGDLRRVTGRINTSVILGKGSTEIAFALRGGAFQFERGTINSVNFVTSFSSLKPVRSSIRGRFRGPDQNRWMIRGDHRQLRLRGKLRRVDTLKQVITRSAESSMDVVHLTGTRAMIQLTDPFNTMDHYYGFLKFTDSSLRYGTGDTIVSRLFGEITISPDRVNFNGVYGEVGDGKFQLTGGLSHGSSFESGKWDVSLNGSDLTLQKMVPNKYTSYLSGPVDVNARLVGGLRSPRLKSHLSSGGISLHGIPISDVDVSVRVDSTALVFRKINGRFRRGTLSGTGNIRYGRRFQIKLSIEDIRLSQTFRHVTFFRKRTRGIASARLFMTGQPSSKRTWTGNVVLDHRGVVLDRFPNVPGLNKIARTKALNQKIRIDDARQSLPIEDGVIQWDSFKLTSEGMNLGGNGTMNLNGNLDLRFDLVLKEETLRGYLQNVLGNLYRQIGLSDQPKEFVIPFYVEGTVTEPKVILKEDKISARFRQKLLKDIIPEKLGGDIMNEILQEFF